jgi:hypothetical protein
MAKWSDLIALIAVTAPTDETDTDGFYLPSAETRREVFANRQSVGYSEFYKAAQAGYSAELKIIVRTEEYNGESYAEHEGKRYKILRTYETKNGEFTELTLTDLTERDEQSEGGNGDGEL